MDGPFTNLVCFGGQRLPSVFLVSLLAPPLVGLLATLFPLPGLSLQLNRGGRLYREALKLGHLNALALLNNNTYVA